MNARTLAYGAVLVAFTVFSVIVVLGHGYLGFIELALDSQWGMQVFVDLVIALVLFTNWMVPDAKKHRISPWPYLALILTLGSIGALAYMLHRSTKTVPNEVPNGDVVRTEPDLA